MSAAASTPGIQSAQVKESRRSGRVLDEIPAGWLVNDLQIIAIKNDGLVFEIGLIQGHAPGFSLETLHTY
jgi:hypothetical protein